MNKEQTREIIEIILLALLAVGIALFIVNYIGQRTVVQGSSMEPTLHNRDQLIVYKFLYQYSKPQKGDVVVVLVPLEKRSNPSQKLYIKRVIATEGDIIEIKDKTVYVNEKALDEPNVIKDGGFYVPYEKSTVPPGHVFVMGDNRVNSKDSRELGPIPLKDIKGKAVFRFWPFSSFGKLE